MNIKKKNAIHHRSRTGNRFMLCWETSCAKCQSGMNDLEEVWSADACKKISHHYGMSAMSRSRRSKFEQVWAPLIKTCHRHIFGSVVHSSIAMLDYVFCGFFDYRKKDFHEVSRKFKQNFLLTQAAAKIMKDQPTAEANSLHSFSHRSHQSPKSRLHAIAKLRWMLPKTLSLTAPLGIPNQ